MSRGKATDDLGTLAYALLGLLADEPMTGYELSRAFELSLGNAWSARHGQIYPALARLQGAKMIAHLSSGPRGSKTYKPTPEGLAKLRQWIVNPDVSRGTRNESVLHLFFLWLLSRDERAEYLRKEEAYHMARLARYRAIAKMFPRNPDAATRWSENMLAMGLRTEQMMVEWTRWAAKRIAEEP